MTESSAALQAQLGAAYGDADLAALVRTIPDYPIPGILFRDVTTLLLDGPGFALAVDRIADRLADQTYDLVAGIEARGFVFASALAYKLGIGVLLLRKQNKLPGERIGIDYALEYGQDRIEMHADACTPGARVLLVDDLIATGGTALAGAGLLRQAGAIVEKAAFVIDLPELGGADRLREAGIAVEALIGFEGE
jgi:adenine phosphoribosyltransferase